MGEMINKIGYSTGALITLSVSLINLPLRLVTFVRDCRYVNKKEYSYESLDNFKSDFDKEKKKLGLDDLIIHLEIDENTRSHCKKNEDGSFSAVFNPKKLNSIATKHELFHIKRMHKKKLNLKYLLLPFNAPYEEWLATSYAIKRTKREAE